MAFDGVNMSACLDHRTHTQTYFNANIHFLVFISLCFIPDFSNHANKKIARQLKTENPEDRLLWQMGIYMRENTKE